MATAGDPGSRDHGRDSGGNDVCRTPWDLKAKGFSIRCRYLLGAGHLRLILSALQEGEVLSEFLSSAGGPRL